MAVVIHVFKRWAKLTDDFIVLLSKAFGSKCNYNTSGRQFRQKLGCALWSTAILVPTALFQAGIRRPWECPVGAGLCWAVQCCCRTVWALSSPTCTGCWGCSVVHFQPGRCSLAWWKVPVHSSVGIRGSLRSPLTQAILFSCISKLWRMLTMMNCLFHGGAHCQ